MVKFNPKKGAQGIGTLIVFIAMILVASVAAGVLIQTGSSLQSQALDVGRQSQERLTTDIEIIQLFGDDASDGQIDPGIDNFTFVVRLGSGSTPIKLADLLVKFDAPEGSQNLVTSGNNSGNATHYATVYKVKGSNWKDQYLGPGDLVELGFVYNVADPFVEGETGTLRLITKNGAVKPIQVSAPSAMTEKIVYLFP